ncbi:hypothetical protein PGTUg99_001427 [Puccinia graminis f. sp. tritici]|uniref:Uncharacterized protein n=1 Tax=Puccinia graminis f. sp. tritici TaxID=56615 RepID=A0A5B0NRD1_PUCGR|nr:hypothetical protein PGTUg99_001427 [Puccinia graminis f. sp. tritici]
MVHSETTVQLFVLQEKEQDNPAIFAEDSFNEAVLTVPWVLGPTSFHFSTSSALTYQMRPLTFCILLGIKKASNLVTSPPGPEYLA